MHNKVDFQVGTSYQLTGDVAKLKTILNVAPNHLEELIGYRRGRLSNGYYVFFLNEAVGRNDFIWGDQTKFSGRWEFIDDVEGPGVLAQREDALRFQLFKESGFDENKSETQLQDFMAGENSKLNVRDGSGRIVKVFPVLPHDQDLSSWIQYPDSHYHGIAQWTIRRKLWFICKAFVRAGNRFQLG